MPLQALAHLVATCCYLGYMPWAPGSATSLVTAAILFVAPPCSINLTVILSLFFGVVGVWAAHRVQKRGLDPDPAHVVIDEVLGMIVALAAVPQVWWMYLLVFALFRFFDIYKPFPILWVEKSLPGGWGIMMDDVVAGVMARVTVALILLLVHT